MKKFNYLLVMLFLLFAGGMQAQKAWDYAEESTTEILSGETHYYAIQQGFAPFDQSKFGFLNTQHVDFSPAVNHYCIYNFIAVDEKQSRGEIFKIYVLKNVANGMYLQEKDKGGNYYTRSIDRAFRFTARLAREVRDIDVNEQTDWHDYSDAVMGTRTKDGAFKEDGPCKGAEAAHHWVFCHPEKRYYINVLENPFFATYHASSNWLVHEAKERPLNAFEKFILVFEENFGGSFDAENYPIGIDPGCIDQAMFDKMKSVYDEADAATIQSNLTDEEYSRLSQKIIDVCNEYKKNIVRVTPGNYYILENYKKGFMLDNGSAFCNGAKKIPEVWDVDKCKYIWKVEAADDNGKFYFKNMATGKYLAQKEQNIKMYETPANGFTIRNDEGLRYFIDGNSGLMLAADLNNGYVRTDSNPVFWICKWFFHTIDPLAVDTLQEALAQNIINKKLKKLVNAAERDFSSLLYVNGLTFDGYYSKRGAGLVTSFEKTNADEPKEGKRENAFDGNASSYYHTVWSDEQLAPADDWHWVQVDLGKEVEEIYLKVTKRFNKDKSNPTRFMLQAPSVNEGLDAAIWTDVLYEDTMVYTYATNYGNSTIDSSTYIEKIKLNRPVQHLRFATTMTNSNVPFGKGPSWHIGEMRFYDAADVVDNPLFLMIPQQLKDNLAAAIGKGVAELEEEKATEATCALLEQALDEFWAAYPDPDQLTSQLENIQQRLDVALENAEWIGYYQPGSVQKMQAVVDAVKAEVDAEKILTLDDIERLEKQLSDGWDLFSLQLNLPTSGTVYLIKSASVGEDGEAEAQTDSYVTAPNADENSSLLWNYAYDEDITSRWNALWLLEKNEDNLYAFKNLATGLYACNPYWGADEETQEAIEASTPIHCSATPSYFRFEASMVPGQLVMKAHDGRYVTASNSREMTIYTSYTNARCRFIFEELQENNFNENYSVDCKENKVQIITLPIAVSSVFTEGGLGSAYKVLGRKGNVVHLDVYDENEVIEAGEPFVIVSAENETNFDVSPFCENLEALLSVPFNYAPVVKNGLVSAPKKIVPGAGYGIISGEKILSTESYDEVVAGTGFFNSTLPETDLEGTLQLTINGTINGEGTAVETLEEPKKKTIDVYSLSGVKILNKIDSESAVKSLPKGLYIIGNCKLVVK